jgi:hypothetical protein
MTGYKQGIGFDVKNPPVKPKDEKSAAQAEMVEALAKELLKQQREQTIIWNGHGN